MRHSVNEQEKLHCITVRGSSFEPAELNSSAVEIKALAGADIKNDKSKFIKQEVMKNDRPELASAKIVISGGRGLKSGDNFKV